VKLCVSASSQKSQGKANITVHLYFGHILFI
jgi:hypothetical protein